MDGIVLQPGMIQAAAVVGSFPAPTHYWNLDTTGFLDLAGGWTLTENDGTVTIDATGGPDGGPAVDLDSTEELIRVGGEYWDGAQSNLSVSIWAKADAFALFGNWIFSWRGNSSSPNDKFFQISINATNARAFIWDRENNAFSANSTTLISTGQWYHFVATHDGNNLKLYIDGALEATVPTPSAGAYSDQLIPLALGVGSWATTSSSLAHDGMLAKCGVWDVALTGSEVHTLYNSGNGLNYDDLPI